MPSLWSVLVALTALCSYAVEATPLSIFHAADSSDESQSHGRALLGACRTAPFAQCGGRGMNGPRDGIWRCCPAGYYCKQSDKWWWSCQKGSSKKAKTVKKPAPKKKKPAPKKKKPAPKKRPAPKKKSTPKRKNPAPKRRSNRRTSIGGGSYQNPTEKTSGGPCDKVPAKVRNGPGHWCKLPKVTGTPQSDTSGVVVGRSTVYNGPLWTQVSHCGKRIWPVESNGPKNDGGWEQNYVKVAMSWNHMGNYMEPNCGRKMCIRIIGYDEASNQSPPSYWRNSVGITMPGIVWDLCPECDDDHIDLLAAYPFSRAKVDKWNPFGDDHNRIWPSGYYMNLDEVYGVGIWKVEWGWNDAGKDCSTYF